MSSRGHDDDDEGDARDVPTGPVSPFARTKLTPPGDAVVDPLALSDLPSLEGDALQGFSAEGETLVTPPVHTAVREALAAAVPKPALSLVDDPGATARAAAGPARDADARTATVAPPVPTRDEPQAAETARRLLEEAATLLRASVLQVGARPPPGLEGLQPSLQGALRRIEQVRWIIGEGGSRG